MAGSTGNRFYIVVTNTGMSTADNVVISDVVPAALTVTDVSGTLGAEVAPTGDNNIQWSIPTLSAGQSVTLTVTYSVAASGRHPAGEQHGQGGQRRGDDAGDGQRRRADRWST